MQKGWKYPNMWLFLRLLVERECVAAWEEGEEEEEREEAVWQQVEKQLGRSSGKMSNKLKKQMKLRKQRFLARKSQRELEVHPPPQEEEGESPWQAALGPEHRRCRQKRDSPAGTGRQTSPAPQRSAAWKPWKRMWEDPRLARSDTAWASHSHVVSASHPLPSMIPLPFNPCLLFFSRAPFPRFFGKFTRNSFVVFFMIC